MRNIAVIEGNIVRDCEISKTTNGNSVCNFTVAVNRGGERSQADYINVTAWGKYADELGMYGKKGALVSLMGITRQKSFEVRGEKRYSQYVEVEFLKVVPKTPTPAENADANNTYHVQDQMPQYAEVSIDSEDLPF